MDKDWLETHIKEQAESCFEKSFENFKGSENCRQAFQKVENTNEWKAFKKIKIEDYQTEIEQSILAKLEGLEEFFNKEK